MHQNAERLEFAPPATVGLLRALVLAVLAHGLLLSALTWGVRWQRDAQVISVEAELWSAVPQEAAPPAPVLEPVTPDPQPPEETPPKSSDVDIAQEQEKLRLQRQKALATLQEELRQDKLRQKLEKDRLERARQQKFEKQQAEQARQSALTKKKTALDSKQLEDQRQKNLQRMASLAGVAGSVNATGTGTGTAKKSSGPSAGYAGRIRARIKPNIVFTEDILGNPTAEVEVRTSPDGTIVGRMLLKSSGIKTWDDAVIKAIDKTEVLPRDIDGKIISPLTIVFSPKD